MKVFLSWSGEASHKVASALREWLPYMIHSIRPFISSGDISKGDRWSEVLAEELKDAQHGIICVTPYNVYKPWMNFEAGALTRVLERSCVTPFLFELSRASLAGPLAQFQSTEFTKDDVFGLIYSINSRLAPQEQLEPDLLQRNFDHWWVELSKELKKIRVPSPGETRAFYSWLRTFEDLAINDLKPDCSTIWFVTADVFRYALREGVRNQVLVNAHLNKVKYKYLIPEPSGTEELAAKKDLEVLKEASAGRVQYHCLPRDLFEKEAASDYIMFESRECGHGPSVFVKLPVPGAADEYWFATAERAANSFYHRFDELWARSAIVPSTEEGPARPDPAHRVGDNLQLVTPSSHTA